MEKGKEDKIMATRKNPCYPPGHEFTTMICKECGEMYEPACEYPHKCRKQNSYPISRQKRSALKQVALFGAFLNDATGGGYFR